MQVLHAGAKSHVWDLANLSVNYTYMKFIKVIQGQRSILKRITGRSEL
jgi:hypothetical protein